MLFDQFGAGQMGNGQGPPNPQQAQGSPNFQLGNWGNVPQGGGGGQPNFAAMLQQFLQQIRQRPQGGQNLMGGMGGGAPPNVQAQPGGGTPIQGQAGNDMRTAMPMNAQQMTPFLGR